MGSMEQAITKKRLLVIRRSLEFRFFISSSIIVVKEMSLENTSLKNKKSDFWDDVSGGFEPRGITFTVEVVIKRNSILISHQIIHVKNVKIGFKKIILQAVYMKIVSEDFTVLCKLC